MSSGSTEGRTATTYVFVSLAGIPSVNNVKTGASKQGGPCGRTFISNKTPPFLTGLCGVFCGDTATGLLDVVMSSTHPEF